MLYIGRERSIYRVLYLICGPACGPHRVPVLAQNMGISFKKACVSILQDFYILYHL